MLCLVIFALLFYTCGAFLLPQGCIDDVEVGIKCKIDTGGAEVKCPIEKNIIRVMGDYQDFRIQCASGHQLQFKYDGTRPTEAIRVNSWRDVTLESRVNKTPPFVSQFHVKVKVLSVEQLIDKFKSTLQSNLPTSPTVFYSRSGLFQFETSSSGRNVRKFHIFFEEPDVDPSFINRYQQNEGFEIQDSKSYFVPCRSTYYTQPFSWGAPELRIHGDNDTRVKADYEPTSGFNFILLENGNLAITADTKFRCVIPHNTDSSKTIIFDPAVNKSAHDTFLTKPSLTASLARLWSYFLHQGRSNVRCNPNESTLYFIAARNPIEHALVRDFVLPDLANRSLYVEEGTPNNDKTRFDGADGSFQTHRGTLMHIGSLYCANQTQYNLKSFVTNINRESSLLGLNHSIEWGIFQKPGENGTGSSDRISTPFHPELYLELEHTTKGKTYDFESFTFQCHVHPLFSRPVVWEVEQNGSLDRYVENDLTLEPSTFTVKLKPGLANISCRVSLWALPNRWYGLTTNVTVLESVAPKFAENQQLNYEFSPRTKNPYVNATAFGVPRPNITCSTGAPGDDGLFAKLALEPVTKLIEETTNKTEERFLIYCLQQHKLYCKARNGKGMANIKINITDSSNRCSSGAGTIHQVHYYYSFFQTAVVLVVIRKIWYRLTRV